LKGEKAMCEFISWKEYQGQVLFLTNDLISEKLEDYKKFNTGWREDLVGHGAIEWFLLLEHGCGRNQECTNFSSPSNFPREIVDAIKAGKMTFGPFPDGLLCAPLYADYKAKRDALYADYKAKRDALDADYKAKCAPLDADYKAKRDALDADYNAKRDALYADYNAKRAPLYADYNAKCAPLDADYKAKRDALDKEQWALFADPNNRADAWK
jgi:hypothetical protein